MFQKILVALNPQEDGKLLFEEALALAKATNAQLTIVSVLTSDGYGSLPPIVYPGLSGYAIALEESAWQDYQKHYRDYQEKNLRKLQQLREQASVMAVRTDVTQTSGSPGRAICDAAKEWKADLVIVGSRGRKGLSELLLGSVSNYVMHHVACSVMVIHPKGSDCTTAPVSNDSALLAA
jgi:nucleotide-binding universal stress UspA family protein